MSNALVSSQDWSGAGWAGEGELNLNLVPSHVKQAVLHKQNLRHHLIHFAQQTSFAQTSKFGLRSDQSSNMCTLQAVVRGQASEHPSVNKS